MDRDAKKSAPKIIKVTKPKAKRKPAIPKELPLPKYIQIGFRKYSLKPAPDKSDYLGLCLFERNEMQLKNEMHGDEQRTTIFHEYCHARMHDTGLEHMFNSRQIEAICDFFAFATMDLVRDSNNWQLLEWARQKSQEKALPPYEVPKGGNYPGEI